MTLSQLIAKLIDLEIEEGATEVRVRDGAGQLSISPIELSVTDTGLVRYVELSPGG